MFVTRVRGFVHSGLGFPLAGMSFPIFLPARRDFYFSYRLLLLFALNKIAETGDSGAESNQKAIRT
jgi:hypothetical protein